MVSFAVERITGQLEAELRQHYELVSVQNCAQWKKLHLHAVEARQKLEAQIETEYRGLCKRLKIDPDWTSKDESCPAIDPATRSIQPDAVRPANGTSNTSTTESSTHQTDKWSTMHHLQSWVAQERFNIQEAFTSEAKKIQSDLTDYLQRLDADFAAERTQIIVSGDGAALSQVRTRDRKQHTSEQKRGLSRRSTMLLHSGSSTPLPERRRRSDVSETNQQLDELKNQLQHLQQVQECSFGYKATLSSLN